jgi:hypothetical protein
MKDWQEAALKYDSLGLWSNREIAKMIEKEFGLTNMYHAVRCYIYRNRKKQEVKPKPEKRIAIQNQEPEYHDGKWDGTEIIRFAIMSDTHFGSKYAQITHLHSFYDLCAAQGIKDVYHAGDITDGLKMRPGHEYELYASSADEQLADVIKNYPKRDGITTRFITGNHDASLFKHVGFDIGAAIAKERDDMKYLGRDCAVVNLTPDCTLELRHPWDGSSYAVSYKLQKMIEAMEADSKPNILAVGNYHKELSMFYRNIHGMLAACFQSQTPFMRNKSLAAIMGGFIVTIRVDKNGYIQGYTPDFIPYHKPIKDDYKNYSR